MKSTLVFRDLFAYGDGSLAWVCVYLTGHADAVALVVEPDDNPGRSAINSAEGLIRELRTAFGGIGDLRTFVRSLQHPRGPGWTELLVSGDEVEFERRSLEVVETLCGVSLETSIPEGGSSSAFVRRDHPLLRLIPEPEIERNPLDCLAVVTVAELPWPHNPFNCEHSERFTTIECAFPASDVTPPAVGAQWFLTLSEADLQACPYHEADWRRVASVSVDVLRGRDEASTINDMLNAVAVALEPGPEREWCASLFIDPIIWSAGQTRLTNGQHRVCALKAANAPMCVVETEVEPITSEASRADPRRLASAEIARFWATHAAG